MLSVWTGVFDVVQKCDYMAARSFVGTNATIDRQFFGRF